MGTYPNEPQNNPHPNQQWQGQPANYQPPKKKRKGLFGCLGCLGILVVAIIIVIIITVASGGGSDDASSVSGTSQSGSSSKDDTPQEYKSALKKGQSYAKTMHMSKQGVYNQLTSEVDSFSQEAAQYAIDNMGDTDWNQNAVKKGQEYQKQNMSPEAVRNQLTSSFEGFTPEEADYAVQHLND